MFALQAGSHMSWRSLLTVKAAAVIPLGRWKIIVDQVPVGIDGADGRRACNVTPVSLTADGIVP
jgi:hypothetical protein